MHKTTHVFPIIGGRKIEHLEANIAALDISLSDEQIKFLDSALPFNVGFPQNFCVSMMWLHTFGRELTSVCRATVQTSSGFRRTLQTSSGGRARSPFVRSRYL